MPPTLVADAGGKRALLPRRNFVSASASPNAADLDAQAEYQGDFPTLCRQLQLACDNIGVRAGIVGGTGGSEFLLILPKSADDASKVEEIFLHAQCQAGVPPFFMAPFRERAAFYVTAKEHHGDEPEEQDLQNVYWGVVPAGSTSAAVGSGRKPVDLGPAPPSFDKDGAEENIIIPATGWDSVPLYYGPIAGFDPITLFQGVPVSTPQGVDVTREDGSET